MKAAKIIFWVCLLAAICLLVAGFLMPPVGVIDGSVLTGVGELFGFATLGTLPTIISGRSVELTHGQTQVKLGDDD